MTIFAAADGSSERLIANARPVLRRRRGPRSRVHGQTAAAGLEPTPHRFKGGRPTVGPRGQTRKIGRGGRIRTFNLRLQRPLLCRIELLPSTAERASRLGKVTRGSTHERCCCWSRMRRRRARHRRPDARVEWFNSALRSRDRASLRGRSLRLARPDPRGCVLCHRSRRRWLRRERDTSAGATPASCGCTASAAEPPRHNDHIDTCGGQPEVLRLRVG